MSNKKSANENECVWKVTAIVLLLFLLIAIQVEVYNNQKENLMNLEIDKANYDSINDYMEKTPYKKYAVCNIEDIKCVLYNKIN